VNVEWKVWDALQEAIGVVMYGVGLHVITDGCGFIKWIKLAQ